MAAAHRDSICSLGPSFYTERVVADWSGAVSRDLYVEAMQRGEVFFIAFGQIGGERVVLGFASDYMIEGARHGTSVYVRGAAARRGIGAALYRLAEAHAIASGATLIDIEASLAGEAFYRPQGFVERGRGETHLPSGRPIACVFMRKQLGRR